MATAIPPLKESEQIEFGDIGPSETTRSDAAKIVVASYNIRYAVGRFLISSGVLRKTGLLGSRGRESKVAEHILRAARAFLEDRLLPAVDLLPNQNSRQISRKYRTRYDSIVSGFQSLPLQLCLDM